jgi:hypothetical protein
MKYLALVVLTLLIGCATVPPGTPATPVSTFDACSDTALKTAAEGILGQVATALATADYATALATLAATYTTAEVTCAVQLAVSELQTKAAAATDKLAATELANGQAWLTAHTPAAAK